MKVKVNYFNATSGKWAMSRYYEIPRHYIFTSFVSKNNNYLSTALIYKFRDWLEQVIQDRVYIAVPVIEEGLIDELIGYPMMVMPA